MICKSAWSIINSPSEDSWGDLIGGGYIRYSTSANSRPTSAES